MATSNPHQSQSDDELAIRQVVHRWLDATKAGDYETVHQMLGHKSIKTTIEFYCGLEQQDAFRRYDAVLEACLRAGAAILARSTPREAAALLGAGERLLDEMRSHIDATDRRMHTETQVLLQAALDPGEIETAWKAGWELTSDEAVSLALSCLD